MTKYSTTSAKIVSNVANKVHNIFHRAHKLIFTSSCSNSHGHNITSLGGRKNFFHQYTYTTRKCGFLECQLDQSVHVDPRLCPF